MTVEYRINTNLGKLKLKGLARRRHRIPAAVHRAGFQFIGDIQEEHYSGRKPDDTGLNVQSGNLRDSWFPLVFGEGSDVVLRVATDEKYGRHHEFEDEAENIPVRTSVRDDWRDKGLRLIREEITAAIRG